MSRDSIRADLIAGITVALILVPQSMAYAQLAGLPVVYGLYASFIPVIIATMWGSSNQLHTGPVAMLSLMSAAALVSFASPGSDEFIQLSIMLALMVGILRFALGIFRLGAIVNLLSSPVIVGFTNAAALIIGLSQLSKVIGVPFPRSESYLSDLWQVLAQIPEVHWLTLIFSIGALVLMQTLRKVSSAIPGVLVAVVVATIVSAIIGYESKITVSPEQIQDEQTALTISTYAQTQKTISDLTTSVAENLQRAQALEETQQLDNIKTAQSLRAEANVYQYQLNKLKNDNNTRRIDMHRIKLRSTEDNQLYLADSIPEGIQTISGIWRFNKVTDDMVVFSSGGAVVGNIPQGLPEFNAPEIRPDLILALLPAALVMALIGFMEATSISKAIAATTGERVDTSKELVGQGLANIAGSFFGSYTVSGSFSRSAVAAKTGAKSGLFAIVSALSVVLVLLFFTEYLYHLPQAVLAVIVMMAVFSLIRIAPLVHAWKADRISAIIGVITFFATLYMAPSIANGILLGVVLTVLHFLIQTMKPRAEVVSRKSDGTLGGMTSHQLEPISEHFVPLRFDGALTFINVAYFEDSILEAHSKFPQARTILVIGSGINSIDASGEEKIRDIATSLQEVDVSLAFCSLKHQVKQVMEKSCLIEDLGEESFFKDKETAVSTLDKQKGHTKHKHIDEESSIQQGLDKAVV